MKFSSIIFLLSAYATTTTLAATPCFSDSVPKELACERFCAGFGHTSRVGAQNSCTCFTPSSCALPTCDTAEIGDYAGLTFTGRERHFSYQIELGGSGEYMQTDVVNGGQYKVGVFEDYDSSSSALYSGGDSIYCGRARHGRVIMNPTPSVSEATLTSVSEPAICYYETTFDVPCTSSCSTPPTESESVVLARCENTQSNGDPHFRTWHDEHFEFHGQCDIVMAHVKNFADKEVDLDIHLRTKMVRFWSFIESAAIRIGNDILEVKGSAEFNTLNYWANFEKNAELTSIGGFPVSVSDSKERFTIDLDSVYPGQKIEIKTFKEFVSVKIIGASEESFGKSVGISGNFKTGKTLGRDGVTELHDFTELGLEWQVLPSDGKLFHEAARPQFPELCYLPEDPRGGRARRLDESNITIEDAEAACASLKNELDRKDCVYDILATQDMDMVGAF